MTLPDNGPFPSMPATVLTCTSVRQALALTYPAFSTLADISQASAILRGSLLAPKVLDTGTAFSATSTATGHRFVFPSRKIGSLRSPRAQWIHPLHRKLSRSNKLPLPPHMLAVGFAFGAIGFEPHSTSQARAHPSWPQWSAAIHKELQGLIDRGCWEEVTVDNLRPGVKPLPTKFVFKDKLLTGAKARLVVRGDLQFPKLPTL